MNTRNRQARPSVAVLALATMLTLAIFAVGGDLEPPGPPTAGTMNTLGDIYAATVSPDCSAIVSKEFAQAAGPRDIIALYVPEYPGSGFHGDHDLQDASKVIDVEQRLTSPYDPDTGLPTGDRRHGPVHIVKTIDKASPGLHHALCTGQTLNEVTLDFYWVDPVSHSSVLYYRITLRQARIVEVGPTTNYVDGYKHMERVAFVYDEIEWHWVPDNAIEMDRWQISPR